MSQFSWLVLLGGLTFFFFGLTTARRGLQSLAGDRMRLAIARLTGNRFSALGTGALITVVLQSSTATILMLMSLASTGLLSLTQAFGVILGADIGTTLVVILISIKKISDYALALVILGFFLEWVFKNSKATSYAGRVVFGFGLIFYGMKLMTQTAAPLAADPSYLILFELFEKNPVSLLFASTLLTVLIQTSAATIGMAIALALAGALTLEHAIPIVLGANVGTCFTAILASFNGDVNGKRVAVAHLLVKVTGVALAMPLIDPIAAAVGGLTGLLTAWLPFAQPGVAGQIALVHLLFNSALAVLFLPFLPMGVLLVSKLVAARKEAKAFGPKYLDVKALETPALAFAQAKQELLRIASLVRDLYRDCLKMFGGGEEAEETLAEIEARDDKIDLLEKEVRFFLAKIARESVTDQQTAQEMALLGVGDDLEGIGDIISKELGRLAKKKMQTGRVFSKEGWEDIQKLHKTGVQNFETAVAAFASPSEELVAKIKRQAWDFKELQQELRIKHIQRLHDKKPEAVETSSLHLDVLVNLRRISDHLVRLGELTLKT